MSFLPADYEAPSQGGFYMKFQDGENKFRILTSPVLGWEDWLDRKPVRFRYKDKPLKAIDPKKPFKHFWAFVVWNYAQEEIQILQITQASVRKTIEALSKNEHWGSPYFYDLCVTKTGKEMDTEYQVVAIPPKELSKEVVDAFNDRRCNLDALFDGGDPFAKEYHHSCYAKGMFTKADVAASGKIEKIDNLDKNKADLISKEDAAQLDQIISECSPEYQSNVKLLYKKANIDSTYHLPKSMVALIKKTALEKRLEYMFEAPKSMDEVSNDDPF